MKYIAQKRCLSCFSGIGGALISATVLLSGCGIGVRAVDTQPISNTPFQGSISGVLHGGPNPVSGANVILWATQSNGYPSSSNDTAGTASLQLATTTTNSSGAFSFTAGSYTCPTGQFAYITATGGNQGAGTNNQSVMMAALGSCSHFDNTTDENKINIFINEATTVAAAYALGNFMYVNDNGGAGTQLVYVGAPANNNATTGSCTGTGSSMTCTAAGLAHAFANAANLVDAVHYDGTAATGAVYSAPPSNTTYGTVPAAEINALANILQYCTNSTGSTVSTTPCGKLFTDATPSSSTNGSTGAPVDGLQAIMDIAKSPTHNVSTLFGLIASSGSYFLPSLTAAPTDWSLALTFAPVTAGAGGTPFSGAATLATSAFAITAYAISGGVITFTASNDLVSAQHVFVYGFPTSTFLNGLTFQVTSTCASNPCSTFTAAYAGTAHGSASATESGSALYDYPVWVVLDANDNVYSANKDGSTSYGGGVSAFSANGTPNWTSPLAYGTCSPYMEATDVNGNVWMSTNESSSNCGSATKDLASFSTSSGSYTNGTPWSSTTTPATFNSTSGIAFDRSSNLWAAHYTSCTTTGAVACLYEYAYNTSDTDNYAPAVKIAASETADMSSPGPIFVDSNYNIWSVQVNTVVTTASYVSVVPNNGTVAAPTWTGTVISQAMPAGKSFAVSMDASSNVWSSSYASGSTGSLSEFTPTYTGATVSNLSAATNTTMTSSTTPYVAEFDGAGTYWYPVASSSGQIYYYVPSTGANIGILPCFLPAAASTCASTSAGATTYVTAYPTALPEVVQVDSTGSIWVAPPTGGYIVQIIGSAAPTWPQLSYGVFGTKPQ